MDIYCLRVSIAECPCMDIRAWISMWVSTLVWIIEYCHPTIMDIHGFLEIHAWICYGFWDQGSAPLQWELSTLRLPPSGHRHHHGTRPFLQNA